MPYLISAPNTAKERIHPLTPGINTIGRSQDNSIVVMNDSLSRRHAEIEVRETRITIRDLQSLNHTFINNIQIEQTQLKDGDIIRCGSIEFLFSTRAISETPTIKSPMPGVNSTVVKEFFPQQASFMMQQLLNSPIPEGSVLRLPEQYGEKRTTEKLKILLEVSKQLSSPESVDVLLTKILDLLFQIMKVDRAVILLYNEQTQQLESKALKIAPGIPADEHFYSTTIINFACCEGKAFVTADASQDPQFNTADSVLAQSIHASMCIPLKPKEHVIGVLYVDNVSMIDIYSDEDVEFLSALTNQAAIAIDNAQLYQKIAQEAVIRSKLERFFPAAVSKKLKEQDKLEIVDTEITALFSDISGFTHMSSTMEPRQVISMLNEYFQIMVEQIVFRYEGTLEKYIGDALFAIWGAPYQQVNDTERAIQAAIDMQWAIQSLNQKWMKEDKQPIQIHIGINSGKVAAGNIGSANLIQYATIGDTTNTTSRICNVAQADEIVISQCTLDKLQNWSLPLEALPPTTVKGKDKPLQLYRLLWQQLPFDTLRPISAEILHS